MKINRMITAVDVHAGGEPGRVITGGVGPIPGHSVFDKMRYFRANHDDIRRLMLSEPRGYPGLCCNLLVEPSAPQADAGFIIMEQSEYPPMSGSNTICVVTVLLETGILAATEPVTRLTLEAPAGLIEVDAKVAGGRVRSVKFRNVPAFVFHRDAGIEVPGFGTVTLDVAFGGMTYAIIDADALGVPIVPANAGKLARLGERIRRAADAQLEAVHPENPDISGITIAQFTSAALPDGADGKNTVVISAGGEENEDAEEVFGVLDRSACGTGTCARMALLHARGELPINTDYRSAGILDTVFTGRVVETTRVGDYEAVVPEISGCAWIYGVSQYTVDPEDPFPEGFRVGDIWGYTGDRLQGSGISSNKETDS